jgi:AcrR family transcriptional regulator
MVHRLLAGPIEGVNLHTTKARRSRRPPEPPEPSPPADLQARGAKTRQRLLDAGATVLPERGYHDARVDDIVTAAGVSHGSFYSYFQNKDDFFRALAEDASARMIELLDAFPASMDEDELRDWLVEWFATYQSNGGVISTWQEMQLADPEIVAFSQDVAASVIGRLVRILEGRPFGDPVVDALALLALFERLPYSVFTLRFTKQEDAIEAMITIIRRGIMGLPETSAA